VRLNLNQVGGGLQNTDQLRTILNVDWQIGDYQLTAVTTYARQTNDTFCDCDYSEFASLGEPFNRALPVGTPTRARKSG
jgi:hypothetical protein